MQSFELVTKGLKVSTQLM